MPGMIDEVKVDEYGHVQLIDKMGDDYRILEAARVSTGSDAVKGPEKDRKLIRYLYLQKHWSPLEQCLYTFKIKMPLFVFNQLSRHRTARLNVASARYKEFEWEVFQPEVFRAQDTRNKQGSSNELFNYSKQEDLKEDLNLAYDEAETFYRKALSAGVAREMARTIMPMGQYTEFFWNIDLRNLLHFLELRMDSHAQQEMQDYANAIYSLLDAHGGIPWTLEVFEDMRMVTQAVKSAIQGVENFSDLAKYISAYKK